MTSYSTLLRPTPRRLRVIEGPLAGTVYSLGDRFAIGRSPQADLPLIDERVSREHAVIVAAPDGFHWLIDQSSHNGTYCGGQAIDRLRLTLESRFRIEGSAFVLEDELLPTGAHGETQVVSDHGVQVRSGTLGRDTIDLALLPRACRDGARKRRPTRTMVAVYACDHDGVPYDGNLIEDIAALRSLTVRKARRELHTTHELDRLERLSQRLQMPHKVLEAVDRRRLHARFTASVPATVRRPSGQRIPVATEDIGFDGTHVLAYGHDLRCDEQVWLVIDLITDGRARSLVLRCHVAWTSANHLGLSFSDRHEHCMRETTDDFDPNPSSIDAAAVV